MLLVDTVSSKISSRIVQAGFGSIPDHSTMMIKMGHGMFFSPDLRSQNPPLIYLEGHVAPVWLRVYRRHIDLYYYGFVISCLGSTSLKILLASNSSK